MNNRTDALVQVFIGLQSVSQGSRQHRADAWADCDVYWPDALAARLCEGMGISPDRQARGCAGASARFGGPQPISHGQGR